MKKNQTLGSLDLSSSNIDFKGAQAIADALEKNQTLTSLNLARNKIGAQGVQAITKALEKNKTLISLNLFENHIRLEGVQAIVNMLGKNKTLRSLHINETSINGRIGYEGIQALTTALKNNFSLLEAKGFFSILDRETKPILRRNRKLFSARQAAKEALQISKKTVSIAKEKIDERQKALEITRKEAHVTIQFEKRLEMINDAIRCLEITQIHMADKTLSEAKIKEEFQELYDVCISEGMQQLAMFCEVMKEKFQIAIDSIVEHVSEVSPLFPSARFLMFQLAYSNYRETYSPTQAFVEALPLLKKKDGTLIMDFVVPSEKFEKTSELATQQKMFDSIMLTAAGQRLAPNEESNLTNDMRVDLLRYSLLSRIKDILIDTEFSKNLRAFFPEEAASFIKTLTNNFKEEVISLDSSFDVTKENERKRMRVIFDVVFMYLKPLLTLDSVQREEATKSQLKKDLYFCFELIRKFPTNGAGLWKEGVKGPKEEFARFIEGLEREAFGIVECIKSKEEESQRKKEAEEKEQRKKEIEERAAQQSKQEELTGEQKEVSSIATTTSTKTHRSSRPSVPSFWGNEEIQDSQYDAYQSRSILNFSFNAMEKIRAVGQTIRGFFSQIGAWFSRLFSQCFSFRRMGTASGIPLAPGLNTEPVKSYGTFSTLSSQLSSPSQESDFSKSNSPQEKQSSSPNYGTFVTTPPSLQRQGLSEKEEQQPTEKPAPVSTSYSR